MLYQESPIEYIQAKGWRYKRSAGEIIIQTCPFCQDIKWHLYINRYEGTYFCFKCQAKGNLYQLKKHMGDLRPRMQKNINSMEIKPAFRKKDTYKLPDQGLGDRYHAALFKNKEAMYYLKGRGISEDSIKQFKLGYMTDKQGAWISIPHYRGEKLINIKFRHIEPLPKDLDKYKRIPDCQSILFNIDTIKNLREKGIKKIYLTEGEFDGITLLQQGIENVVSVTCGAKTFNPEWIDDLKGFEKIYLAYDPDQDGQGGAYKAAKKLGLNRCFNIQMPEGQDINDFFNNNGDLILWQTLIDQASKYDLPGVIPIETAIDLLCKEVEGTEDRQGLVTQWENVNKLIKGFYPGDLIILSAYPKTGKTSFALDITRYLVFKDIPVLFYCQEMRPERLVKKFIQSEYRKEILSESDIKAFKDFTGLPLYFLSFIQERADRGCHRPDTGCNQAL